MSGTFPTTISPTSVDIISNQPTLISISDSGRRQARADGGHLWEISLNFPVMRRFEFEPINAFIMSQIGGQGMFKYAPPNKATPLGLAIGAPVVAAPVSAGSSAVAMSGLGNNLTGVLKAGDIITFSSHQKVYMLTADMDSNSSGVGVALIQPDLIQDVAASESVTWSNVAFNVYFDGSYSYKTTAPNLISFKIKFKEAIL